jgi:hypothetical protein
MKSRFGSALWGLAVCILGTSALHAGDQDLTTAFKLHGNFSSPSSNQGLTSNVIGDKIALGLGCGFELGYKVGDGRITGELGYAFQSGDQFLANTSDMAINGAKVTIDPKSIESRKNKIEGLLVRIGYEAPLQEDLSWRAGLQFGGNTFKTQVIGNTYTSASTTPDSYWYVGQKTASTPSPFAGLSWKIDSNSSVEVNAVFLSYTSIDYKHVANTNNSTDTQVTTNRFLPQLEVAYVFRF